jgi:hypothetical protein
MASYPTDHQMSLLKQAFPTSTGIGVVSGFLTVQYASLPPKPWPIVMAGLPVYISTSKFSWPLPAQRYGGVKRIMHAYVARSGPTTELFKLIINSFEKDFGVAIASILNLLG